jgi:hypothetical protein
MEYFAQAVSSGPRSPLYLPFEEDAASIADGFEKKIVSNYKLKTVVYIIAYVTIFARRDPTDRK